MSCVGFIATTDTFSPVLSPNPLQYDVHVYQTPSKYMGFSSIKIDQTKHA